MSFFDKIEDVTIVVTGWSIAGVTAIVSYAPVIPLLCANDTFSLSIITDWWLPN